MKGSLRSCGRRTSEPVKQALRITCTYNGQNINLESVQRIKMVVPPSDAIEYSTREGGFWIELRDTNDKIVYRRITDSPIRDSIEVRSDNPNEPFERHDLDQPTGRFTILVPDTTGARSVVIFSSPFGVEKKMDVASEMVRFDVSAKLGEREELI